MPLFTVITSRQNVTSRTALGNPAAEPGQHADAQLPALAPADAPYLPDEGLRLRHLPPGALVEPAPGRRDFKAPPVPLQQQKASDPAMVAKYCIWRIMRTTSEGIIA